MSEPRYQLSVNWPALKLASARASHDALVAWRNGEASAEQQKLAWRLVQELFCDVNGVSWRPDDDGGERLTCALEGRRSVALQLRRATESSLEDLVGPTDTAARR